MYVLIAVYYKYREEALQMQRDRATRHKYEKSHMNWLGTGK